MRVSVEQWKCFSFLIKVWFLLGGINVLQTYYKLRPRCGYTTISCSAALTNAKHVDYSALGAMNCIVCLVQLGNKYCERQSLVNLAAKPVVVTT